jgi:hypothetical protein
MGTMSKILLGGLCWLVTNIVSGQSPPVGNLPAKVALIHLKISRQGDGYSVVVRDVTLINDEKKRPAQSGETPVSNGGLVCYILDNSNVIVDSVSIAEPLETRYEYPRDDGTIGSKEVKLDEKDIVIRSVYNPRMEYLHILKVTGKTTRQSLATVKLPTPKM